MNKEQRATQRLITKFFKKWIYPLGLGDWSLEYIWYADKEDDEIREIFEGKAHEAGYDGICTLMACIPQWEYKSALMYINLKDATGRDERFLENYVLHELCHLLIHEMRDYKKDNKHEERVVASLQRAFIWVKDGLWGK